MTLMRHRILYVEDHLDTSEMLATMLGFLNIEACVARTAAEGLALAVRESFDLYLLDVRLPDKSGLELCNDLRAHHPKVPIVFISANAYAQDRQRALSVGADAYLTKPIEFDNLKEIIAEMLGRQEYVA